MGDVEVRCSHCEKPIEPGGRAVVLDHGEAHGITLGESPVREECWHATCFQIARVRRAIDEMGGGEG